MGLQCRPKRSVIPITKDEINLTNAEWGLMECLWEDAPRTAMQAANCMKESVGWAKSTTLTMLRRMTDKGYILCDDSGSAKRYVPAIQRGDAVTQETKDFLNKVYCGSVSMMMSTITKKQELSQQEIDELYRILNRAEEAIKCQN